MQITLADAFGSERGTRKKLYGAIIGEDVLGTEKSLARPRVIQQKPLACLDFLLLSVKVSIQSNG